MPWLSLWLRRTGLDPGSVLVRSVMDKVALGQGFFRVLRFYPVNIIPPILHTHLHLHVALTRRTNGRILGTFEKAVVFRKSFFNFLLSLKGQEQWTVVVCTIYVTRVSVTVMFSLTLFVLFLCQDSVVAGNRASCFTDPTPSRSSEHSVSICMMRRVNSTWTVSTMWPMVSSYTTTSY